MKVEDALAEAMERQVAHVQAPPTLGRAVRRRHRAHVIRLRTAGAALLTAAVAVAVPVALNAGRPAPAPVATSPAADPATGQDKVVVESVTVPDVTGLTVTRALDQLKAAGLVVDDPETLGAEETDKVVLQQKPAAGEQLARGGRVMLTLASPAQEPQDLGDLGDGRTFGGIHIGYLPDGLAWDKWSGKNGFGKKSYTTSFSPGGDGSQGYGVQVVVYEGQATQRVRDRIGALPSVEVGGREGYLAHLTEGGEVAQKAADDTTATVGFFVRDRLAVEAYISPVYAKKVDALAELKKIAEAIEPAK
ncbi:MULTISPECIES: PASTA domain-containing protein [unclassified Nonomuraea]|uniref:PASTA domain-containing protein n=1 Tax=unclassified Nonomuraea TaxID=2593643 RepID=UPI0033EBF1D6